MRDASHHPDESEIPSVDNPPRRSMPTTNDVTRNLKAFTEENRSSPDELDKIKTDLQRTSEKVSAEDPAHKHTLGEWSKLLRDTQVLHDKRAHVVPEGDQIYKETQEMKDAIQTRFFQASTNTYRDMYSTNKEAGWAFPDYEKDFIRRYTESEVDDFYRLSTRMRKEYTRNGSKKLVGINYYNPVARVFINYSHSRVDVTDNLKPLYDNETKKEMYQRTLPHSEMMHHLQQEAIDEYNQEHRTKISLEEKVPNMTFAIRTLSHKEYLAIAPQLNIDTVEPTIYNRGDDNFSLLMDKVPNFKAIRHLISQRHPHLEVTKITIIPDRYDSAIVHAQERKSL